MQHFGVLVFERLVTSLRSIKDQTTLSNFQSKPTTISSFYSMPLFVDMRAHKLVARSVLKWPRQAATTTTIFFLNKFKNIIHITSNTHFNQPYILDTFFFSSFCFNYKQNDNLFDIDPSSSGGSTLFESLLHRWILYVTQCSQKVFENRLITTIIIIIIVVATAAIAKTMSTTTITQNDVYVPKQAETYTLGIMGDQFATKRHNQRATIRE